MRYYIATSLANAAAHNLLRDHLQAAGHELTYDWTEHGSLQGAGDEVFRVKARAEVDGVLNAHALVVLLPGGRGTHVELGIALGSYMQAGRPRRIVLVGDAQHFDPSPRGDASYTCLFYWALGIIWVPFPDMANPGHRWHVQQALEG